MAEGLQPSSPVSPPPSVPSTPASNKRLTILLIILVVLLVALVLIWQTNIFSGPEMVATSTSRRILTAEEMASIAKTNQEIMLQFATATTAVSNTVIKQEMDKNSEIMDLFSPAAVVPGTNEGKKNYEIMQLFQ